MRLDAIFQDFSDARLFGDGGVVIKGVSAHSKTVAPGFLFVSRKGNAFSGNQFIDEAIRAGAVAILTDMHNPFLSIPQVVHPDPASLIPHLADRFYESPSEKQFVVGVTGTNGKTTTAYLIAHLLAPCGLISTIEYKVGGARLPAPLTTPDLLMTQKLLRESVRASEKASVMEVSSHGLKQGRVEGIHFSCAVFTNLSQDHLDYHGTMDAYFAEKMKLFTGLDTTAVVNIDDPRGKEVIEKTPANVVTYGFSEKAAVRATEIAYTSAGSTFKTPFAVTIPLIGAHNVSNALAAIAVAKVYDLSEEVIAERLATFPGVPGRMQRISSNLDLSVFVDFAHTPDALQKALESLRPICQGKLYVVFGCGGDRDREKRPLMGAVARELADRVIVTSDNPRSEDPAKICEEIGGDMVIVDRKEAISYAISEAEEGDVVLIAGRGHETEQIIGSTHIPFSDYDVAKEICMQKGARKGALVR